MALRSFSTALKNSLINNDEFNYAHLVKFEKPTINEDKGRTSRKANIYTYITDGAFDIIYDDGSNDAAGNPNGPQTYIANKIRSVGSVTETVEAKASNMSLTLDTTSLGASATSLGVNFASGSITVNSNINLVDEGFREGDKVKFTVLNGSGNNNAKTVIIKNFTAANVFTYTAVDTITANNDSAVTYKIDLVSEELTGVISDKLATTYQTYLNREVFIYKAHFDPITNAIIGEPYLLFKGIISGGSVSENPEKESKITWTLTSHWGDFSRVSGRLTVDEQHRALDGAGIPDRDALVRPDYAGDLGFMHANQAVNVMALYNATETTYKQVDINGFWFGGKRLREVESTVQRRVDLEFNLTPKYLPVVYGIRKTDSIPVFVDTDNTDPTKVYVAYAICEGQVAGLLDFYVDGTGSVCVDEADFDLRSSNTEADLTCKGRMDQGDTLKGNPIENLTTETDDDGNLQEDIADLTGNGQASDSNETGVIESNVPIPTFGTDTGVGGPGILHEQYHKLTSPLSATYIFHAGKGDQDANPLLVSKAAQNQFKIQNSYYTDTKEYWGPSHRLLDTAYVVAEYTIGDGETSIPELDFIVRGRGIKCFNYDSSYARDTFRTAATLARQFNLGDTVTLKKESDDSTIATGVEIIDKWSFLDIDGAEEYRFRLSYTTAITENFYMTLTKGGQTYEYNFSISTSEADVSNTITSGRQLAATITAVAQNTESVGGSNVNSGLELTLGYATGFESIIETAFTTADAGDNTLFHLRTLGFSGRPDLLRKSIRGWTYTTGTNKLSKVGSGTMSTLDSGVTGLVFKDVIRLEAAENTSDDFYNGYGITLTRFDANGVPHIQKRRIVDYIGASRIAIVDIPWESDYLPTTGDRYVLTKGREDIRVSLNPAMQLLDYLTNERYGRGLDLDNDINLETFKEAARQCDTRSDVTVVFPDSTGVAVDDVYKIDSASPTTASNFNNFFKGTVSSVVPRTVGGVNYDEVTFTNVIGKLGTKFATWLAKTQEGDNNEDLVGLGTLLWNDGKVYEVTTNVTAGATYTNNTKFPTHDSGSTQNGLTHKTAVNLTKVSGSGASTVSINISLLSANGNPLVKSFVGIDFSGSGYSLYDADDIKYWKYIGWDSNHQRNVTRHQMNQIIATSNPVFDNINLMLSQFNGILRYSNGKYELAIRTKSGGDGTFVDPEIINESDIIGSISLKDGGVKKSYNSVNTSIVDPQTKFEARSVSFFNSDYLKEDRNIPKQGQYGLPGITNYYNARYNINQRLDESRFGLTISFKMMPKGALLLPGNLIRVNYPRFGYENKEFRITNVTTNTDCLINITADEHNDSAFTVTNLAKPRFGRETEVGSLQNKATVNPPTGVGGSATTSSITVTWTNGTGFNVETDKTQVWARTGAGGITNDSLSPTPNTNIVSLLATVENGATTFVESVDPDTSVTRSYWLRHVREVRRDWSNSSVPVKIFSEFHATGASGGYSDTSDALFRPRKVDGLIFYARASTESTSVTSAPTLPTTKFYNFGLKGVVSAANSTSLLSFQAGMTGVGAWLNELVRDTDAFSPGVQPGPVDTTDKQVWASRYTGQETSDVGTGSISITLSEPFLLSNMVAKVNTSDVSTFGGTLIDDADAATARTTLGLGTAATAATGDFIAASDISTFGGTLVDDADASAARTTLGLGTAATSASTDFVAVTGDSMTGDLMIGASSSPEQTLHIGSGHILVQRGVELRSKDTGGTQRTLVRINGSNDLEYGYSGSGAVKFMGGGSYTERMRIHTNGNIGIGESDPTTPLHITHTGGTAVRIKTDGDTDSNLLHFKTSNNTGQGYVGTEGGTAGTNFIGSLAYSFMVGGTASGARLQFLSAGQVRGTFDTNGSFGIGTTSPNEKLHIKGSGDESVKLKLEPGTTAGNVGALILGRTDGSGSPIVTDAVTGGVPISGIAGILLGSSTNAIPAVGIQTPNTSSGHIVFNPKGSEKVRITATGDVGINTPDPIDLLHVNGTAAATSLKATSGSNTNQVKITSGSSENIVYSMSNDSGGARALSFQLGLSGEVLRVDYNLITAQDRILIDNTGVAETSTTPNILSKGSNSNSTTNSFHLVFTDADGTARGQITSNKFGIMTTSTSDYRLKTDIQDMSSATAKILALKPRNFKWTAGDVRADGFIAHEVAEVVPEAVLGEKDGTEMQAIDQSKLIPILVKTIQELEARIAVLEG